MFKKFSFVGVSSAAVTLAVLCPWPARALNYDWSYTMGQGNLAGTLYNISTGSNTAGSSTPAYLTVTSGTGNYAGGASGGSAGEIIGKTFLFTGGEILADSSGPLDNGFLGPASFEYTGSSIIYTATFFGGSNGFATLISSSNPPNNPGFFDLELRQTLLADGSGNGQDNSNLTTGNTPNPQAFTLAAVPAPLPLLGLGAAAAFSRKLKQRIALRRKRGEVGLAG